MRALELTRSGILGTLAVLAVAAVCVRLGMWQLDRRSERLATNAAIAARVAEPPVRLGEAPPDTAGLTYRRAVLDGIVDNERAIVLAGRSYNGAPGVHLLTPFRLGAGAVLVNRGWLPAADGATADVEAARLDGRHRITGVLVPFPDVNLDTEVTGFREQWFRVDGNAIRDQYPYPVAALYLQATAPAEATEVPRPAGEASADRPVPLGRPTLDPGPHLSYAIQWFSFATIALVGWLVLVLQRTRRSDPETPSS